MCLLGRKGLVECARRVGREIVQHHPDPLRLRMVDLNKLAHASGEVEGRTLLGDRDLAPGAGRVHEHEQVHRPGTPVLVDEALHLPRLGRDPLPHFADQLGRALVEAHDGALRVRCFGVEVEHVLHAGDELAVDARDAPHLLTPGLERVLGQTPTHRLAREARVRGEPHHLAGQQLQGPAGPPLGRAGARGGHQQRFLLAGELARRARARLLVERPFHAALHEAALDAADGRDADVEADGDGLVRDPGVGRQQDLGPLELAGGVLAAAEHGAKLAALDLAQLDPIAYVHGDLLDRGRHGSGVWCASASDGPGLHGEAGSVSGLHRRLHARERSSAGRSRPAAPLRRQRAIGAPDGGHVGTGRPDPAPVGGGAQHRGAGGSQMPTPSAATPTRQILCAEGLGPDPAAAGDVLTRTLEEVGATGGRWIEPELHRLRGELLLAGPEPDLDGAETAFVRAVAVAARYRMRLWELRAATSLARVYARRGATGRGRDLLARLHGWFTEGLETPDLRRAKAALG